VSKKIDRLGRCGRPIPPSFDSLKRQKTKKEENCYNTVISGTPPIIVDSLFSRWRLFGAAGRSSVSARAKDGLSGSVDLNYNCMT